MMFCVQDAGYVHAESSLGQDPPLPSSNTRSSYLSMPVCDLYVDFMTSNRYYHEGLIDILDIKLKGIYFHFILYRSSFMTNYV